MCCYKLKINTFNMKRVIETGPGQKLGEEKLGEFGFRALN